MPPSADSITSAMLLANLERITQTLKANPETLETARKLVHEHLASGPQVQTREPGAHVTEHLATLVPAIARDPRFAPVAAKLAGDPSAPVVSALHPAAVLGGGVLVVIVIIVVAYCLGGETPAPGTSADVRC